MYEKSRKMTFHKKENKKEYLYLLTKFLVFNIFNSNIKNSNYSDLYTNMKSLRSETIFMLQIKNFLMHENMSLYIL